MKRGIQKLSALLLSLLVVCNFCLTVRAHDVPDMDRLCSITITMRKGDKKIPGGTMTLYRVGEVTEDDGNYRFQPAGAFAECGESFETLEDAADLAMRLKDYAKKKSITGLSTKKIGQDGVVTFSDLEVGLYLVVQHKPAPGYAPLAPFLVSLPYMSGGKYVYDLTADPKTDLEQEPEPTDPPPTEPDDKLPQTGQLWWPVPLLACGGLAMFSIGLILNRRRESNEAE